jgi:hypothetical protein
MTSLGSDTAFTVMDSVRLTEVLGTVLKTEWDTAVL